MMKWELPVLKAKKALFLGIVILALYILLLVLNARTGVPIAPLFIILSGVVVILVYLIRLYRWKFLNQKIRIDLEESFLIVEDQKVLIEDIRWIRFDDNSAVVSGLVIKLYNSRISLYVSKSDANSVNQIYEVYNAILATASKRKLNLRNYYDQTIWRVLALFGLLLGPLVFLITTILIGYSNRVLVATLVWFSISLSFYFNVRKNSS